MISGVGVSFVVGGMIQVQWGWKTMGEKKTGKNYAGILLGEVAALLWVVYMILCFEADAERILPRTKVNGISLGGMTWEEAAARLNIDAKARCSAAQVKVSFGDKIYTVAVGQAMEFDGEAVAKEILGRNRAGFFAGGFSYLKALLTGYDKEVLPELCSDKDFYQVLETSGVLQIDETDPTTYVREDDRLVFTMGTSGNKADKEKLIKEILMAVQKQDYKEIMECPVICGSVEPVDLDQVYREVFVEAANATLDPRNDYAIVEEVRGICFDKDSARRKLDDAGEGDKVIVELTETIPEISARDLRENLFMDLLGSYTTKVSGSANRLANIRLAVDKCQGLILLADEVFSFNDTVGDQNEETGFKISEGVENGKIVPAYGGGICQITSTIFVAALYADLEIVEYQNHDLVAKYVPAGLDAAVAWGELDFQVRNNTAYPMELEIVYENGYLTVNIWGTRTKDQWVEIETEVISPVGEPLEVLTYRMVYDREGNLLREEQVAHCNYM